MKPVGEYVKIEKLPKKDDKIVTVLDSGEGVFEEHEGILVFNFTPVFEKEFHEGGFFIPAGSKVIYTNPAFERKEGNKTYVFVHKKFVIAYE